jgi:O-antigen/teichoic acid export membrane protein
MLYRKLGNLLRSRLVGGVLTITVANTLRLVLNLISFVIVAGRMGTTEFGTFATVVSIVNMAGTFSGLGAQQLIIRRVSRAPSELPEALATSFVFLAITAIPLIVACLIVIPLIVGVSATLKIVLLISLADVVFTRINLIGAGCFQALERPIGTALLNIVYSASRVVAALAWVFAVSQHTAASWSFFYCLVTLGVALISLHQVMVRLAKPKWAIDWPSWKDGLHFSLQMATFSVFREVDKPVVASLSSLATVGTYAASFRMAEAAVMPIQSLMYALFTKFFKLGANGVRECLKLAIKVLPFSIALGILAGAAILLAAPFAPLVLGHAYDGSVRTLRIFSVFPLFFALFTLAADVLIGSNHVLGRTIVQLLVPLCDVGFCFAFVPTYGAAGAALSAVLTHAIASASAWAIVLYYVWKESVGVRKSLRERG